LKNSFQPINKMPENIKTIIIVDDLTTTGATLKEVATCIKQSNPHIDVW
jgi:predicted amidophosphoribosyltransferase